MSIISEVHKKKSGSLFAVLLCSILTVSCGKEQSQMSLSSLELEKGGLYLYSISKDLEDKEVYLNKAPSVKDFSSMTHQEVNEIVDKLKSYINLSEQILVSLEAQRVQRGVVQEEEELVRQNLLNARAYLDMFITSDLISRSSATDQTGSSSQLSEIAKKNMEAVMTQMPLEMSDFFKGSGDELDEEKLFEAINDVLNLESVSDEKLKELAQVWEDLAIELSQTFQVFLNEYLQQQYLKGNIEAGGGSVEVDVPAEDVLSDPEEGERFSASVLLSMQTLMAINFELQKREIPISHFSREHSLVRVIPLYQKESSLDRDVVMELFSVQEAILSHSLGSGDALNTETGRAIYRVLMSSCGNTPRQEAKYEEECPLRGEVKRVVSVNPVNSSNLKSDTFQMDFDFVDANVSENINLSIKSVHIDLIGNQTVGSLGGEDNMISVEAQIELASGEIYNLVSVKKMSVAVLNYYQRSDLRGLLTRIYSLQKDGTGELVGKIEWAKQFHIEGRLGNLVQSHYSINDKPLTAQEVEDIFVGEELVTLPESDGKEEDPTNSFFQ